MEGQDINNAQTKTLQQQLQEALSNQAKITNELENAITKAENSTDLTEGLPEEYIKGFINCGNVLAFEDNLYTVKREGNEIVVKNIYKELVDKSAEAAAKTKRESQSLKPGTETKTKTGTETDFGGRRTRKQRKLSKKSLKKMSKKELFKMMKSMKKK